MREHCKWVKNEKGNLEKDEGQKGKRKEKREKEDKPKDTDENKGKK